MFNIFALAILATFGCSMGMSKSEYKEYLNSLVPEPIVVSEEIAKLTADEYGVARCLASNLFKQTKLEAKKTRRRYTYYVKVFDKNPDPGILSGLQDELVSFEPASEGRLLDDRVYDPAGSWAEIYAIHRIEVRDGVARAEASFYRAPLWGSGYEYHLVRKGETWELVSSKMRYIS